jgi:phage pi2 protein 07
MRPAILCLLAFGLIQTATAQQLKWFKGNTHTHSLWSDGNDFPEMITDWYKQKGYDFLAISDHNVLQAKEVWMGVPAVEKRRKALGKATMDKYLARFGDEWVTTRDKDGVTEVRLKKLEEYRPLLEEPGKFLIVQAEEISAGLGKAPVHMNAVNLREEIKPIKDLGSIQEVLRANFKMVNEQSARLGVPMFTHINHPNFRWAFTAEDMAAVLEENFWEIYNGHPGINWLGDETRVGHEKLWDIANTLRIAQFKAPPLYGVGTDDSHHYHGEESSPGRGWVMVRAAKLDADEIVKAMKAGDFYASSGVTLDDVSFSDGMLRIRIHAEPGVKYTTEIRGTLEGYDTATREVQTPKGDTYPTRKLYSDDVGKTLATLEGTEITWKPSGKELYFRASIVSSKPHPNPSFEDQTETAWTQPMGWKK